MGFRMVSRASGRARRVQPGEVKLNAMGVATLHETDLEALRISDRAIVLADPATCRIALERPNGKVDPEYVYEVDRGARGTASPKVRLGGALRALGLKAKETAGLRAVEVVRGGTEPDRIVLQLPRAKARGKAQDK